MDLLYRLFHRVAPIRPGDKQDAEELRYKYGAGARAMALERARNTRLPKRDRRHWLRVSNLL
jgi:hypothetical protein